MNDALVIRKCDYWTEVLGCLTEPSSTKENVDQNYGCIPDTLGRLTSYFWKEFFKRTSNVLSSCARTVFHERASRFVMSHPARQLFMVENKKEGEPDYHCSPTRDYVSLESLAQRTTKTQRHQ